MPTLTTHTLSLYTYDGSENGHNFLVAHLSFARACDFPPPFKMHFSPWKWVKDFELTLFIFKLIALRLIEMWDYYQCFICNSSWLKIHTFCMCEVVRCSFRRNIFTECRKCSGEWQLHCWQLCRGFAFLWWNVTFSNYIHWKRVHTVKRHAYVSFAHSFERKTARAKCMTGWIKGWKLCHKIFARKSTLAEMRTGEPKVVRSSLCSGHYVIKSFHYVVIESFIKNGNKVTYFDKFLIYQGPWCLLKRDTCLHILLPCVVRRTWSIRIICVLCRFKMNFYYSLKTVGLFNDFRSLGECNRFSFVFYCQCQWLT